MPMGVSACQGAQCARAALVRRGVYDQIGEAATLAWKVKRALSMRQLDVRFHMQFVYARWPTHDTLALEAPSWRFATFGPSGAVARVLGFVRVRAFGLGR